MGWRGTLALAVALLAAGLYLYRDLVAANTDLSWETVIGGPRAAPPGEQITHLLSFDPATVTAVHLRHAGRDLRSQRVGRVWSGVERSADIDDFLANLLGLAVVMPLDVAPDELAAHGLDPPEAVIELQRVNQPPVVLLLGRHNPPSTGVYAQVGEDGPVILTGALASWELEKALRALSPTAAVR